jgi:hypothetical protein
MLTTGAFATTEVFPRDIVPTTAKVVLLAFIFGGVLTLFVVRRRRLRQAHEEFMHTDVDELLRRGGPTVQPGYEAFAHGAMPNTPWPDRSPSEDDDDPADSASA